MPGESFWKDESAQLNLGGVGRNIRESADVLGKSQEAADRQSFSKDFNVADFDSFGGATTDGKWTEIARFKVPADTEYSWGYGKASAPDNQGLLYVDLQTSAPAAVDGQIRFAVESSTGRKTEVVADFDTERLDASKTNREQMVPFPEQVGSSLATQDAYLVVEMDPSADATISSGDSDVIIPVTEYDLS